MVKKIWHQDMRMQLQGLPHRSRKDRRGVWPEGMDVASLIHMARRMQLQDTPIVKVCYIGSVVKAFQQIGIGQAASVHCSKPQSGPNNLLHADKIPHLKKGTRRIEADKHVARQCHMVSLQMA
ncbi:hypothetical protein GOBAR_AA30627 [Gossypium barbadense]|uniref:Uncharacterized protein n=1 Tax=Gossypium barbadense TaxID=3634 RepID=A0A2P5WG41_GOSBA|nr:hypothetical protein GOBAR_AA30627 [Gossypium barbadense]